MTTPNLSVIIISWNTRDELRSCLASVLNAVSTTAEVILVDNASSDGTVPMVRSEFPSVKLIENKKNLGFARGCNQGITISKGRYVLLLNPDSIVQAGNEAAIVKFGNENPDIGIFGLKVLNPDGSIQYSCRRFPTLRAGIFRYSFLGHRFPNNPYTNDYLLARWDHNEVKDVDWVSGAALVMRRELIDDIGMLDERFFMYCEDVDLGYRAKQAGWRVVYFPLVEVVHNRGQSSNKNPNRMIVEHHISMYKYYKKHYAIHSSIFVRPAIILGLIARASFFISRNNYYHFKWMLAHWRDRLSGSNPRRKDESISDEN